MQSEGQRPHYVEIQLSPEELQERLSALPKKPSFSGGTEFTVKSLVQARRAERKAKPERTTPQSSPVTTLKVSRPKIPVSPGCLPEHIRHLKSQGWLSRYEVRNKVRRKWPAVDSALSIIMSQYPGWHTQTGTKHYFHPSVVELVAELIARTSRKSTAYIQNLQRGRELKRIPPQKGYRLLSEVIKSRGWPAESTMKYCSVHQIGILKSGYRFVSYADVQVLRRWRKSIKDRHAK